MTTAHAMNSTGFESRATAARPALRIPHALPVVATASVALVFAGIVLRASDPMAYLVGLAPIAWIAIEAAWRLGRRACGE